MRTTLLATLAALALAAPAEAGRYRLESGQSRISFTYLENGRPREGVFAALAGAAEFVPEEPGSATMELAVSAAGIDLGDPVRSYFAQSIDWFDAEAHPLVVVSLARLDPLPDGRWRAETRVRIKGTEVKLPAEITLTEEADGRLRARGEVRLDRHEYRLGIGFSSLFATIGREVTVRFDLAGTPVR